MRIQKLDSRSKKNLLEDLLNEAPISTGQYEEGVANLSRIKRKGQCPVCLYRGV